MGGKQSKLDKPTLELLQRQTRFDSKQIQQWYNRLKRYKGFQKDFTKPLDRYEFQKLYKNYFPFGDASKYSSYVFQHLDSNGNGLLDFEEFIKSLDICSKGSDRERLECIYD
jgi:Ca2+-binding EF-hand superfamily protein